MKDEEIKSAFAARLIEPVFASGAALQADIANKKRVLGELVERFGLKQK